MISSRSGRLTLREKRRGARSGNSAPDGFVSGTELKVPFRPLKRRQIEAIHHAALELLATLGMANPTPRVIETAVANGCYLDACGRLRFPQAVVEDALSKAAREFPVFGRLPKFDFEAKNGRVNFCTGGAAVSMLETNTRQYRSSVLADLYNLARLCDSLENIQWFTRPVVATDVVDVYELDVNTVYACAAGTAKHIATSFCSGENLYKIHPMLDLLAGGAGKFAKRPFCTVHATTVVSPMTFAPDSLDVACAAVDIGMPIHCQTGPQAGATAPAALAGTLVQGCAESLASLSIINMLNPGHPVILGNWLMVSDLRTGAFSGGGPEQALLGAASSQMSAWYGIPGGVGAGMSDSNYVDGQASFEKSLSVALAALAGGGMVYESAGMLSNLLGCSFEAMVVDNQMLGYIRRIARGIEIDDDTLSVAVIKDSVLGEGHYLGHEQTLNLMESEFEYPRISDRASADDWQQAGSVDMLDRATIQAQQLLQSHYPQYIKSEVDAQIRRDFPIQLARETMSGRHR